MNGHDYSNCNPKKYGELWLNLASDENDFTGPLALDNYNLGIFSLTPLPSGNDKIVLSNSTARVFNEARGGGPYSIDRVRFAGNSTITISEQGHSSLHVNRLTLEDAGTTLRVEAPAFSADEVVLNGGTLEFPVIDVADVRRQSAGLVAGWVPKNPSSSGAGYIAWGYGAFAYIIYTNGVATTIPGDFTAGAKANWQGIFNNENSVYRTYSGYIWNDSGEEQTWTILNTLNHYWRMKIGEKTVSHNSPSPVVSGNSEPNPPAPVVTNFTLKAGANRFELIVGNCYVSAVNGYYNYGPVATNGLVNWDSDFTSVNGYGIMYDTQGRASMDATCYQPFTLDADAPVFSRNATPAASRREIASATGGTIDVSGAFTVGVRQPENVAVSNGMLYVTATGTVASVSLGKGAFLMGDIGRAAHAGFMAARSARDGTGSGEFPSSWQTFTNRTEFVSPDFDGTQLQPQIFYDGPGVIQGDNFYPWTGNYYHRYQSYQGYLWNDTLSPKTIYCKLALHSYAHVMLNDTVVATLDPERDPTWEIDNPEYAPVSFTMTLNPGANKLLIRTYDRYGLYVSNQAFVHANVRRKGLENWDDEHGLMWTEVADSVDMNDYHTFTDPGDGSFATTMVPPELTYGAITGVSGTVIDLAGGKMNAGEINGPVAVTNGTLSFTGSALSFKYKDGAVVNPYVLKMFEAGAGTIAVNVALEGAVSPTHGELKLISAGDMPAGVKFETGMVSGASDGRYSVKVNRVGNDLYLNIARTGLSVIIR